jgi:hypothetical protein
VDSEYDQADNLVSPRNLEDENGHPRFPEFIVEVDMSNPSFKIEMLFTTRSLRR